MISRETVLLIAWSLIAVLSSSFSDRQSLLPTADAFQGSLLLLTQDIRTTFHKLSITQQQQQRQVRALWDCSLGTTGYVIRRNLALPSYCQSSTALYGSPTTSDDDEYDDDGFDEDEDYPDDQQNNNDPAGLLLRKQLEQQQAQIDVLMELVQQQQQASPPTPTDTTTTQQPLVMAPQKVMLFIDGTWLYYSLHERDDPMVQRYGRGWQRRFDIQWEALPRILCQALQKSWSSTNQPLEMVRASVFTSYRLDTPKSSWRYQLFEDLKRANYDVHMMETVGKGEKCVDIQLAVEMLHYATVPHAYDIALLLTGDKDFMPAMMRTRQKGRRVGLVSLKRGCNRALHETEGLKDFDVIWLEDHLDELVVPKANVETTEPLCYSTKFFLTIVTQFLTHARPLPMVSSRDVGRYLKFLRVPAGDDASAMSSVLDELKASYGGMSKFMEAHDWLFEVQRRSQHAFREDPSDNAYWISLRPTPAKTALAVESMSHEWTEQEEEFLASYSTDVLRNQRETAYYHSLLLHEKSDSAKGPPTPPPRQEPVLPLDLTRDYCKPHF